MENPTTWKPIHHQINKIIETNQERSLLAYELADKLPKEYLGKIEKDDLIETLDDVIWDYEDSLKKKGFYGSSLPMRLDSAINKLKAS